MSRANPEQQEENWCALVVGNSRLHWAVFLGPRLQQTWDISYDQDDVSTAQQWVEWQALSPAFQQIADTDGPWPPLWLLSVVPSQIQFWQSYPRVTLLQLFDIPLSGVYPSLGCDRALAVWAAGVIYGWPILVIDGGTALTLTGANANGHFVGGAILPGVALQLRSLTGATTLPAIQPSAQLPPRWARNTSDAIHSGVLYTLWAGLSDFIQSWCQDFGDSKIVITGGDRQQIFQGLQAPLSYKSGSATEVDSETPEPEPWQNRLVCDETLLFQGIQRLRAKRIESQ
jgi:type III pantothenate kinase